KLVSRHPFTDELRLGHLGQIALLPELLARGNLADVYLDHRERGVRHGVAQHDRGVREPARIDDRTSRVAVLLEEVDQCALVVRLEGHEIAPGLTRDLATARLDLLQRRPAVHLRIACAEQVQVRTIYEEELHAACSTIRAAARSAGSPTSVTSLNCPIRRGRIQRSLPARAFLSWRTKLQTPLGRRARVGSAARSRRSSSRGRTVAAVSSSCSASAVA